MELTKKYVTQLSYDIIGCAIKVHKELGAGLLESVYESCLAYELDKQGFNVQGQQTVSVYYDRIKIDAELRYDLLVEDLVIIELKAVETLLPIHEAQLLTYMKLLKKLQGLLINFLTENISKSYKPFVNEYFKLLPEK